MSFKESSARTLGGRGVWTQIHVYTALFVVLALFVHVAQAQVRAGDAAPRLDAELLDGSTLRAVALDGKVVVHMFWATWCPFCMAELPHLQKLHQTYASRAHRSRCVQRRKGHVRPETTRQP